MLLLAVLLPVVRLRRLCLGLRLWLLWLLLLQGRVRLQHYAVHGAAQGALGPRRDGVNHRGGRGHGMLLPRLRHPGTAVGIQFWGGVGAFAVRIQGEVAGRLAAVGQVGGHGETYFAGSVGPFYREKWDIYSFG